MEKDTALTRSESDQKIRERLLEVISEFQSHFQAMQGLGTKIVNPFTSVGEVVKKYVNPLSLFLNDIRQQIEKNQLTYIEALEKVVLFSRQTRFRNEIVAAVKELEQIEKNKPYFLYALQSLADAKGTEARAEILRTHHRELMRLNKKYQRKFGLGTSTDVIPWRIKFFQSEARPVEGTYARPSPLQLSVFRSAIINLSHNLNAQPRFFRFYHYRLRRTVRKDIIKIAELLFDYGFTVEKIIPSRHMSFDAAYVENLLNDYLMSKLEKTASRIKTVKQISHHVFLISLLSLKHIIPVQEFCRITDYSKALRFAGKIERTQGGKRFYRRIVTLYHRYDRNPQCSVVKHFLNYMFCRAYSDYRSGQTGMFGGDFSRAFIFPSYFNAQAVEDMAQQEMIGYSSKGKEEMLELLKLLLHSLENPQQYRNKKIVVLGDIHSGAMGKVSIGVYKNNLVALKKPASDPGARDFPRLVRFLKHERRIHEELTENGSHGHPNIVECYGLIRADDTIMLALGYFPADNLENLVARNRKISARHPEGPWGGIILEEIRRVFMQLIDVLRYMKRKQVIHRDLKPANILFLTDQHGRLSATKIVDFGIAVSLDPSKKTDLFNNKTVGTLNYMAPEQLIGRESHASDIYSSGAIIYTLLAGRVPIRIEEATGLKEKLRLVYRAKRIPLFEANPSLEGHPILAELSGIVERMLSLNPHLRPQVDELRNDLNHLWSKATGPEALLMPIRYVKEWGGPHEDSLVRTSTETLDIEDINA